MRIDIENHRKEKNELDDRMLKDKYIIDAIQAENRELQEAKTMLEKEREQLYLQVKDREEQVEQVILEN